MAWIVADSFDYYASSADLARSVWDSYTASIVQFSTTLSQQRFGSGQCLNGGTITSVAMTKTMASNEATIYLALAFYRATAQSGNNADMWITYRDAGTAQCTICFESGGAITLKRGDYTGTVIATYAAAFAQDVWCHFQIRVVIDPAAGTFTVRKNGQTSDSFSATGLNSRSTANSFANSIALGCQASGLSATNAFYDDILFYSGSGAAPNTWVGDVRAICLPANGDTAQKQFATIPATVALSTTLSNPGGPLTVPPNTIYYSGPWTVPRGGAISQLTITGAGTETGHAKFALYAGDNGGFPGTLYGVSTELTNPSGAVTVTFSPPVPVSPLLPLWIAVITDANWTSNTGVALGGYYAQSMTYATGFPSTATIGALVAGNSFGLNALIQTGNAATVGEKIANGDTDYAYDSTVNDSDLYDMCNVPVTPFTILGVVAKIYQKKSDSGTRQGQILLKSGATQVAGPDTVLGTTYTYMSLVQPTDPATGTAWTLAGVNAAQVGQKVTL